MRLRIEQELSLLRQHYPNIEHLEYKREDWFRLPHYSFPIGWYINDKPIIEAPIVFKVGPAYATSEPYGFAVPAGINFKGETPHNTDSVTNVPFDGEWQQFSWTPDSWESNSDVRQSGNLLIWVRSFTNRLQEGV